jgi:hypothetical protein
MGMPLPTKEKPLYLRLNILREQLVNVQGIESRRINVNREQVKV